MARSNQRGRNNNNPEGRNQYSGGLMNMARERPVAAAAAVGAAAAAGVFLWSRRNQIGDQVSNMSGQISDWSDNMRGKKSEDALQSYGSAPTSTRKSKSSASGRSNSPLGSETGHTELAGAGTSAASSSARATGGRSGKAEGAQNMSPSRDATERSF